MIGFNVEGNLIYTQNGKIITKQIEPTNLFDLHNGGVIYYSKSKIIFHPSKSVMFKSCKKLKIECDKPIIIRIFVNTQLPIIPLIHIIAVYEKYTTIYYYNYTENTLDQYNVTVDYNDNYYICLLPPCIIIHSGVTLYNIYKKDVVIQETDISYCITSHLVIKNEELIDLDENKKIIPKHIRDNIYYVKISDYIIVLCFVNNIYYGIEIKSYFHHNNKREIFDFIIKKISENKYNFSIFNGKLCMYLRSGPELYCPSQYEIKSARNI